MSQEENIGNWARARVSIVIARPVKAVFDFVANPINIPLWMPKLGPVRQTSTGVLGVGTQFHQSLAMFSGFVDVQWEISEYAFHRRVAGRSVAGPLWFNGGYEFEPAGTGTLLTKFGTVKLSSVLSLI